MIIKVFDMKKMAKILSFISSILLIYSCDPIMTCSIINKTDNDVKVRIKYYNYSEKPEQDSTFLCHRIQNTNKLISGLKYPSTDTINFLTEFTILPNDTARIMEEVAYQPYFEYIKSITVFNKDTINLDKLETMQKNFIEKSRFNFEYEVK